MHRRNPVSRGASRLAAATLFGALAWLASVPAVAAGATPGWVSEGKDFILTCGEESIRWRAPGTLSVRRGQGPEIRLSLTLWHGAWIHESLQAGAIEHAPAVDDRGWLRQRGTWVKREGAAPMRYSLALEPASGGAVLHLETEKTADLKLTAGLWTSISFDRLAFAGRRLFARPVAHGKAGGIVSGDCEALLVEMGEDGRAASFTPQGFRELRCRVNETTQGFELNLLPGDFPVGKKAATSLKIGFEALPAKFPGEIEPRREPLAIRNITAAGRTLPRFGKLELDVDLRGTWDNPFDPGQIALDARVTTASGRQFTQPGFFLVDHERQLRDGVEVMAPVGQGRWCVRICGTEPGPVRVQLTARDGSGTVCRDAGEFTVQAAAAKGFLRQSRVDPRYLQFDSGAPFVPIGHNLPGYHTAGQTGPDAIRKMAASGENYNRWWMSSSSLGLEWEDRLGFYRQAQAARLDGLLDLAAGLDFYYMLCMDTHQDFREGGWRANPFNRANGGPCETVSDWFTSEPARNLYKKRLRYTVARWGYSPHVLCWEFGNEFEGWADTAEETKIAWHREMSDHLAQLDPYRHLITTSWWGKTGPLACWELPAMDIVQTHCYTNNDANVAEQVRGYCLEQWERLRKPHVFGEFGIRSHSSTVDKDPRGWGLHNAFWSALCSGCCGIPMPWWHENYIEPLNLYFHFTSIAGFARGLPFGTARWEQVTASREYVTPPAPPITRDVVLAPVSKWGKPAANEFTIGRDGSVNEPGELHELLHGMGHRDMVNPPVFIVDFPKPGKIIVTVGRVSRSGLLCISIDDELRLHRPFPCGEKIGKQWTFHEKWNLWESVYDEEVALDVPAGRHRILVENLGADWMRISRYAFTGCKVLDRPNLLVAALRASPGPCIVWIQNQESDWFNHGQTSPVPAVPPSRIALDGFAAGSYRVEWWETWTGKPVRSETVPAAGGRLTLLPGEVKTDLAAKIVPAR